MEKTVSQANTERLVSRAHLGLEESDRVQPRRPLPKPLRQAISLTVLILLLAMVWQGVKWIGGDPWRLDLGFTTYEHHPPLKFRIASDLNMPHLWDIARALIEPARRGGDPLYVILASAALHTMSEAVGGFVLGASLGLVLGMAFAHSSLLERGLAPYVVASQTVPILAIAPMVVIWLGAGWFSVAVIAAYLTFFPVTINALRGLRSPDPQALELMRSYAATRWQVLWKLRFPAAAPYIFTAFKISATASVVGAIIGELPSGIRDGLGGAILNFNQYYLASPPRLWATIFVTALVGIAFFVVIVLAEAVALRSRQRVAE